MKRFKVLKFILILLILLLLTAGGLAYAYIKTDFLKTPDQLFKKYLLDGVIQVVSFNIQPYDEIIEKAKTEKLEITSEKEHDYVQEQNTNYNSIFDEENEEQETETKKVLAKESLKIDLANKNIEYLLDTKCDEKDFLKVNFIKNDDIYSVHVPEVHEKYLALQDKDLKKIPEKLGGQEEIIEAVPNEIPKVTFTDEEKIIATELIKKYATKISDSIDISLYTKEKYEMNYNGETIDGNKYVLTIKDDKIQEIYENVFTELENDQEFLNLIEGKTIGYYFKYIQASREFTKNLTEGLMSSYKDTSNTMEEVETPAKDVKISLYEYNGKTVKFDLINEDGNNLEFWITNKDNYSNLLLKRIEPKTDLVDVGYESTIEISNKYENNNGEIQILAKTLYNEEDIETEKNEMLEDKPYMAEIYNDEYYKEKYANVELELNVLTKNNNNDVKTKISYETKGTEEIKEEYNFDMKFDSNIEISVLEEVDIILLNDYSKEEFFNLVTEITNNMYKSAEDNPDTLIGGIYKEKIEEEKARIESYREDVYEDVKDAIDYLLQSYKEELEFSEQFNEEPPNIDDYLNIDVIKDKSGFMIDEMELIDGNTIKCMVNDYTFYVKINIDGNEWILTDIQVLYSEDGTIENAI